MTHRPNISAEQSDTPGPVPTVTEKTKIKTTIGTIVTVAVALVGAVVWLTILYNDVQSLKVAAAEMPSLKAEVHELRRDVAEIKAYFIPASSPPTSHHSP